MKVVTGTFHDQKKAAKAVEALVDASIPIEDVSVVVRDSSGEHDVPLEEKTRAGKGAVIGGAIGAALGAVGATLVVTGAVAAPGIGLLAAGPVLAIIRGLVAGLALGEPIGLLAGLDFWKERADLHAEDLKNGAALIAVHSDALHEKAKAILERAGADRVTV
jgi:hypothetical protein